MSVRFQETVQANASMNGPSAGGRGGPQNFNAASFAPPRDGRYRHPYAHELAEAITKGEGAGGYLQAYLKQLRSNPLRTKMLTSGALAGLQELLSSWIAQDRNKNGHYFTSRVPKMAAYGALIAAPMGSLWIRIMELFFAGRSSLTSMVLQILFSNLIVAPTQNVIYLISMAIIAGARTLHQIRATVRAGFWPVMRVTWISAPVALAFAQQFLPTEMWIPFFNFIAFAIGTYVSAHTKKKRLAALRRKRYEEGRTTSETTTEYIRRDEY